MAKMRMSYEERVLCGLALDSGVFLKEVAPDDKTSDEARFNDGFVPEEDLGWEHVLHSGLSSESNRQACTDPLEYAVGRRQGDSATEEQRYEPKSLTRNTRLV